MAVLWSSDLRSEDGASRICLEQCTIPSNLGTYFLSRVHCLWYQVLCLETPKGRHSHLHDQGPSKGLGSGGENEMRKWRVCKASGKTQQRKSQVQTGCLEPGKIRRWVSLPPTRQDSGTAVTGELFSLRVGMPGLYWTLKLGDLPSTYS